MPADERGVDVWDFSAAEEDAEYQDYEDVVSEVSFGWGFWVGGLVGKVLGALLEEEVWWELWNGKLSISHKKSVLSLCACVWRLYCTCGSLKRP